MKTFLWVVVGVILIVLVKLKLILWGLGLVGAAGFLHFSLNRIDAALKERYPDIKSFWQRLKYRLKNRK
jgi:hypothetical protein